MSADTREIVRATVPLNGWPLDNQRASAFLRPGVDRHDEAAVMPEAHALSAGIVGGWFIDGHWDYDDAEMTR